MHDFKAAGLYISSIAAGFINEHLQTIGLALNIIYIGYQIAKAKKDHKK